MGASSGIGHTTAAELARQGTAVALASRREEQLADLAAHISEVGGRTLVLPADVGGAQAAAEAVEKTVEHLGRWTSWSTTQMAAAVRTTSVRGTSGGLRRGGGFQPQIAVLGLEMWSRAAGLPDRRCDQVVAVLEAVHADDHRSCRGRAHLRFR
jgi:NAD(P)-dependent dehydrogenase (short-subunit alcohol dehydrogenase family)